jgi:hypothetical protein
MPASLYIKSALIAVGLLATARFMTERQMRDESRAPGDAVTAADTAGIMGVMSAYEVALSASTTDAGYALYVKDGVLMRHTAAVGAAAVRQVYAAGFRAVTLHIKFNIAELVEMSPAAQGLLKNF